MAYVGTKVPYNYNSIHAKGYATNATDAAGATAKTQR